MRLNASMRQQIITKAIAAKFDPLKAKHKKETLAIGHDFWMHLFGDYRAKLKTLPKSWVYHPDAIQIEHGVDCRFNLHNGFAVDCFVPSTDPLPAKCGWNSLGTIKDEALCQRYLDHTSAAKDLLTAREEATNTLKALLASVGTYASLEKEWPEGKKFYSSLPGDFPGNMGLPMVQINKLNTMLGLPPHTSNVPA